MRLRSLPRSSGLKRVACVGQVWFDDVVVTLASKVTCQCRTDEIYDPAPGKECSPCPEDKKCLLGETFDVTP